MKRLIYFFLKKIFYIQYRSFNLSVYMCKTYSYKLEPRSRVIIIARMRGGKRLIYSNFSIVLLTFIIFLTLITNTPHVVFNCCNRIFIYFLSKSLREINHKSYQLFHTHIVLSLSPFIIIALEVSNYFHLTNIYSLLISRDDYKI